MSEETRPAEPSRNPEMFRIQKAASTGKPFWESSKSAISSGTNGFPITLSFLSIGRDDGAYPDTGESGETYDLEASLEFQAEKTSRVLPKTRLTNSIDANL